MKQMMEGRVAWVTGATGGVGPAVVRALLGDGVKIVATAREAARLSLLRDEAGADEDRWLSQPADLTDPASAQAVVEAAIGCFGRVDILVAVAGGWRGGTPVADTDLEVLRWLLDVNVVTAYNACRAVLPGMLAGKWGRIVTFGARSGVSGSARSGAYASSKAALVALTQSIAAETRSSGVTANALLLSTVDTPGNRVGMPDVDAARWVPPEQIAAMVRFLCSDDAASINGAAIPVYGRA